MRRKVRLKVRCSVKGREKPATCEVNRKRSCEELASQLRLGTAPSA